MKIPYSWIKEWLPLDQSAEEIAEILTMAGLEVDAIDHYTLAADQLIAVRVLEAIKHPEADKLKIATVTNGSETLQIVCGAPNCRAGIIAALAPVGTTLVDPEGKKLKIKKGKLKGVESEGMLCSANELGLGEDHSGILELDEAVEIGSDLCAAYRDAIFDISLTPNLAHCHSVLGVVRELSAALDLPYTVPKKNAIADRPSEIEKQVAVEVLHSKKCPRYACRLIKNVKVGPSPDWLRQKLEKCGIRSINTVVDATNYILLERGQPLHAFDFDRIHGDKIIVRAAEADELFETLDEKKHKLTSEALLICDGERPVALGGIMGGKNSEVSDQTQHVLLESAFFEPTVIRRTSKQLGIQTDSSKRFERGCDPNGVIEALNVAAALIQELAGGEIVPGIVDQSSGDFSPRSIPCRVSRVNHILGIHLGVGEIESIFKRLGFDYSWDGKDTFTIQAPTYRFDVREEIDLIEEVARLYGYQNLPKEVRAYTRDSLPHASTYLFEREMRKLCLVLGLQEILTCDLIGPQLLNLLEVPYSPEIEPVSVKNPTSVDQSILRQSLLPGFLQVLKYNYDRGCRSLSGFEIGKIHFKQDEQYLEQLVVGFLLTGQREPHFWGEKGKDLDFFDLKGVVENLLSSLGIKRFQFQTSHRPNLHPGRQAKILVGELNIGSFGEVHPGILQRFDIDQRVIFGELSLKDLYLCKEETAQMQPVPAFPSMERDWTVTLPLETPVGELFESIDSSKPSLLESVELLYLYQNEKLGLDRQNVTFRFIYRDKNKTLSQEAVDRQHFKLTDRLTKQFEKHAVLSE